MSAIRGMAANADGTALFNNPAMVNAILNIVKEVNPGETVVPGASNPATAIDDEIKQIEKKMGEDWKGYHNDPKLPARYQELLAARDRIKARAA